jgi:putative PIN family toxin of toxin-antitoxin system
MRCANELRVVLDTNVLVSALAFPGEATSLILELLEAHAFKAFSSPAMLAELRRVLIKKVGWSHDAADSLVSETAEHLSIITPRMQVSEIRCKDSDNRVLECALEADADAIVTGNLKHIRPLKHYRGIAILTPREFLKRYF